MSIVSDTGSLTNNYQNFIALSRYARWLEDKSRRETWSETVDRLVNYMQDNSPFDKGDPIFTEIRDAILNLEVLPSMRALMTAGPALDRDSMGSYNCSFIAVDHLRAFDETLHVLMNGTGLGFSVEQKYVDKLPVVSEDFFDTETVIVVHDSKLGWAKAYKELISLLIQGQVPRWDMSKVRPAGARLKTFGGRASGPEPLNKLFEFTVKMFKNAAGRRLKSSECHDIMCMIAQVVVVGGVRRSALISLSDLDDYEMASAKTGNWWEDNGQRALANNSAVYHSKPSVGQFLGEWKHLYDSKSGERGIVNLDGTKKHINKFQRRDETKVAGTNPCGEINLRTAQTCNLTEVVIKPSDTLEDIARKVRIATIIGTWQSTLTNFKYVRSIWKKNIEEERLLGVSLTGIYGHPFMSGLNDTMYSSSEDYDFTLPEYLDELRESAVQVNKEWAEKFGINPSAAITTVKPSGTVSQLALSSSGIHPWYAPYYLRSVRGDNKDPITQLMKDEGIPHEPDVMNPEHTTVFYFPIKAPEGVVYTKDLDAINHLELYRTYRKHYTEHNVSVTVSVRENEWPKVGAWVYDNWDDVGGVSFLPMSEHTYQQAPYQAITEEEYKGWVDKSPKSIDWSLLSAYELADATTGTQELSCVAGGCEIV